ncbi:hypothetical protein CJ030_MR3G011092 [Morella rubra]|uniref:Uncharacterized protein n=1 Tax=Morella rubra TaxID=262757 RepID=A0A6A1W7H3_9ROSI|nr:hypothetical protein CJ030_MR3G011092 [Morella rubra]
MEDKTCLLQELEEPEEDALSLCDLPIHEKENEGDPFPPKYQSSPSRQDFFEFSTHPNLEMSPALDSIIFCGRVMHKKELPLNESQNKWRSESFNKAQIFHSAKLTEASIRSHSFRVKGPKSVPAPATGSFRYSSSGSKKHKVLIGLAKIQPEMELSEIRKRQGRRPPVPMFPPVGTEEPVISGDRSGGGKSLWRLLRPFRCRSHLTNTLARSSFGCFPLL